MNNYGMNVLWFFACSLTNAQTASTFVGTWKVTWQSEKRGQEARLVVSNSGGTWKTAATSRTNPCVGREAPIALEEVNGDEATVRLKFSEVLAGCTDATIRIKKINDRTLSGTRGDSELTITRE